jgi:predicted kinase
MAAPLLVVVQGAPGVGKTTLLEELRRDVALPMLGKDEVKEFLFDRISQSDRDFSRLQGGASFEMMYAFARTFLGEAHSVVIEGAFMTKFARPAIKSILEETDAECLELYCHVHETVRQERFRTRVDKGGRHPAHLDQVNTESSHSSEPYGLLGLGKTVNIETDKPLAEQLEIATNSIRERLR